MRALGVRVSSCVARAFIASCLLLSTTAALGATKTWAGAFNGNWSSPTNWSGGLPVAGDDVVINATGPAFTVTLDVDATIGSLTLGGASAFPTLAIPAGRTLTINGGGPSTVASGAILQQAGNLAGTGSITVSGTLDWRNGTMSGSGTTTIGPSGIVTFPNNAGYTYLDGRTMNMNGTATYLTGTGYYFSIYNGGILNNGGVFDLQADQYIYWNGLPAATPPKIVNTGTFKKTSGTGVSDIYPRFDNQGTLSVESGTIHLVDGGVSNGTFTIAAGNKLKFSGTHSITAPASISGAGTVEVAAGTTTFAPTLFSMTGTIMVSGGTASLSTNASTTNAVISGGTLTGAGNFDVSTLFTWSGGTMSGSGITTLAPGGSLTFPNNTSYSYLDGRVFNVNGPTTYMAGSGYYLSIYNGGVLNNANVFDIQNDVYIYSNGLPAGTPPKIVNTGTFKKTASTGVTDIYTLFDNQGTLSVESGTVHLVAGGVSNGTFTVTAGNKLKFSGTHSINAPATITGAGTVEVASGATAFAPTLFAITGTIIVSGGTANLSTNTSTTNAVISGGTLTGTGNFDVAALFTWSGGTMSGSGVTTLAPTGSLTFPNNSSYSYLDGRVFNVNGPTSYLAGSGYYFSIYNGGVLNNANVFDIQSDVYIYSNGLPAGTPPKIVNSGTFKKTAAAGVTTVFTAFDNTGTVSVESGELRFNGGGTGSGIYSAATGTILNFGGGSHTLDAATTLSGAGTVRASAGTLVFGGTYNITGATEVTGGNATIGGTVTSVGSSILVSSGTGTFNNATALNLTSITLSGGTLGGSGNLNVSGAFVWSGGTMTGSGVTTLAATGSLTFPNSTSYSYLDGRVFNVNGPTTYQTGSGYYFSIYNGGLLNNAGVFDIQTDQIIYSNGAPVGTPPKIVNSGTFKKTAGTGTTIIYPAFDNTGTASAESGELRFNAGGTSSGSFAATTGAVLNFGGGTHTLGATSTLTGAGTVRVAGGTLTFSGTYNITGATEITGGNATIGGTVTSVGSSILVSSGTGTFNNTSAMNLTSITLSGGTLGGSGNLNVSGAFVWSGGTMTGSGITTLAATGSLTFPNTTSYSYLDGRVFNVNGPTTYQTGVGYYFSIYNGGLLNNAGVFDIQTDQIIYSNGAPVGTPPKIVNTGTFKKSAGTGTTIIYPAFDNNGTASAQTGELRFNAGGTSSGSFAATAGAILNFGGGTHTIGATSSLAGAGTVRFGGGTLTFSGTYNITGATEVTGGNATIGGTVTSVGSSILVSSGTGTFNNTSAMNLTSITLSGGTLGGSGNLNVSGAFLWSGGTMTGSGITTLAATGSLSLTNATNYSYLDGRVFNVNAPSTYQTGVGYYFSIYNGGLLNNAGVFDIQTDQIIYSNGAPVGTPPTINNSGVFKKTAGTASTLIYPRFNNSGVVQLAIGTLTFGAGYTQTNTGTLETIISGLTPGTQFGRLAVNTGTATLDGTLNAVLGGGFVPTNGDTFQILSFPSRTGDFAVKNLTYPGGGFGYSATATNITLTASSTGVSIAKTAPATVNPSSSLTYTITVTNGGPDPATTLSVSDTLPASMVVGTITAPGWSCSGTSTVTCTMPSLAVGSSTITIETTSPATTGNITNTASLTAANDINLGDNSASATTSVASTQSIAEVRPASGSTAGGGTVDIYGTDLASVSSVTFGSNPATIISATATLVRVTAPAGAAGPVTITVTGSGSSTSPYTYVADFKAARDFSATPNPSGPWRYGWSATRGSAFMPYNVRTEGANGIDSWHDGGVGILPNLGKNRTLSPVTQATNVTPGQGAFLHPGPAAQNTIFRWTAPAAGGYAINGSFTPLDTTSTDVAVLHNGATLFSALVGAAQPFSLTIAANAGDTVDFTVGDGGNGYTFDATGLDATITPSALPAPSITSVVPNSGPVAGGTTVTINGSNLSGVTSVTFGGAAASISSSSATSITVSTPAHAAGLVNVVVTTPAGTATAANAYTYGCSGAATITPSGPTTFCAGGSVTLTANSGSFYLWSNGAQTQSITVTESGNFFVTVTDGAGCQTTSAPVSVSVPPAPTATISGPTSSCQPGSPITLSAGGTFSSIVWSTGATSTSITVTPSVTTTYSLTATGVNGCTTVVTHTVAVSSPPTLTISAPPSVYGSSAGNVASVFLPASTAYTWIILNGVITAGQGTPTITFTAGASGVVILGVSDAVGNCSGDGSVAIPIVGCTATPPSLIAPADGQANLTSPVTFSWSAVDGATSYDVFRVPSESPTPLLVGSTQSTTLTGSLPSGSSSWYVTAHLPQGCSPGSLTSQSRTLTVVPSANCPDLAPSLTRPASGATVFSPVTFDWEPVANAIGYRVMASLGGLAAQEIGIITDTELVAGLPAGAVSWWVEAMYEGCDAVASAPRSFTVEIEDCSKHQPTTLFGPADNSTAASSLITFSWDAVEGADGYAVWVMFDSGPSILGETVGALSLSVAVPSGPREWWVETLFEGCPSTESSHRTVRVPAAANCSTTPPALAGPAPGAVVSDARVTFSWSPVPNALGYELWLSAAGGADSLVGRTASTALAADVPNGESEWFVRALLNGCPTVDSERRRTTYQTRAGCTTSVPMLLMPLDDGRPLTSPASFQWTAVPGAQGYRLWLQRGSSAPELMATSASPQAENVVLPNSQSSWFVEAFFNGCSSTWSSQSRFLVVAQPTSCTELTAPVISMPSQVSSGTLYSIQWSSVPGAEAYLLTEIDGSNATTTRFDGQIATFNHQNEGAEALTYYYRVRAVDEDCEHDDQLGPLSSALGVSILPVRGAASSTLIGSQTTMTQIIQIPSEFAGQSFTATAAHPWITISPSSGVVPAAGIDLVVTADVTSLPLGTSVAGVSIVLGAADGSRQVTHDSTTVTTTVSVSLVTPVTPTPKSAPPPDALIIPAVAHAQGINAQFQSDVRVSNTSAQVMKYQLTFIPSGETGMTQGRQTTLDIEPGRTIALDDVLRSWFGTGSASVLGTLEVRPLTRSSSSTSSAATRGVPNFVTFASSRTFNQTPNGTFGTHIAAIPFANFVGRSTTGSPASVLSLQQISQSSLYRTNLGFVEGSGSPVSLLVSVFDASGSRLTQFPVGLSGGQHLQMNSFLVERGIHLDDGRVEVQVTSGAGKVTSYASVVNNATGDFLVVTPAAMNETGSTKYVLPGVAELSGGVVWQTDMRLFNASEQPVTATLALQSLNGGAPQEATIDLAPGTVKQLDRVLATLFGVSNDGGAIHITTASPANLVATARTYRPAGNGANFGQFIQAVTPDQAIALGSRPLQLLQVEESPRFRSNVGLAEVSGQPVKVELTVIPPDAKVSARIEVDLAGNQFRQLNSLLASLGLTDTHNARVTVKVLSGAGRVTAYAATIDAVTQDPTFIPAQ